MEHALNQPAPEKAKLTRKRLALRALIIFFAAMVALTVIARAADALTLPQVKTTTIGSGRLTHVVRADGMLEALSELPVRAQTDLPVGRVLVTEGQKVSAGEPLLTYDEAALREAIENVNLELRMWFRVLNISPWMTSTIIPKVSAGLPPLSRENGAIIIRAIFFGQRTCQP